VVPPAGSAPGRSRSSRPGGPVPSSARYRAPAVSARGWRSRRCARAARTVPRSLRGRFGVTPPGRCR